MREFLKRKILALPVIDTALPSKGIIADLGCGEEIVSKYLAKKPTRHIIGIDLNNQKLHKAKTNSQNNLEFKKGNIVTIAFAQKLSGIVIADVLHHLSLKQQARLLSQCYKHLKKDGVLVVKEINKTDVIRSMLSRL